LVVRQGRHPAYDRGAHRSHPLHRLGGKRRGSLGTSVAYNAAKAGLNGLTFGLARQLEPHGILVNTVAPGPTGNTGEPMMEDERAREAATYPLGLGGPEPVAHACLYLAGHGGNWVSGTVLNVTGGRWQG
jgi:NAD(P)-dependent dehydrogenase (short-subunit alcohol dehydrogenase family)